MEYLGVSAAQVIKEVTNTKFQIPKGMEEVNMCEAIEVLMNRRETEGIQLVCCIIDFQLNNAG